MRKKRSLGLTLSSPNKLSSQEEQNEEFEVRSISGHRIQPIGFREFKVSWIGYSSEDDSWVPEQDIFAREILASYCRRVGIPVPSRSLLKIQFGESERYDCFRKALEDLKCLSTERIPRGDCPVGWSEVQQILSALGFTLRRVPMTEKNNLRMFPVLAFEPSLQLGHVVGFPEGTRCLPAEAFRAYYLIRDSHN
jgi:hypothetical protein